jgi:hypothetical protein
LKSLDAQFAYTWSKSLADTDISNSGTSGQLSTLADPFNPHMDYGPTPINRPHIFVGNIVYNTPTFVGQNAFMRHVLGGWELASILSYASGPSLTVFSGGEIDGAPGGWSGNGTGQNSTRPNVVAGQSCYASGGLKHQWLNPEKWDLDHYQLGTFGTSSVGICGGPGLANTDFSLYKNFKVKEKVTLQFRLEFFNLFNTTQFRADSFGDNTSLSSSGTACFTTTVDSDIHSINNPNGPCSGYALNTVSWVRGTDQRQSFGLLTNDRGPREIQYALKITF